MVEEKDLTSPPILVTTLKSQLLNNDALTIKDWHLPKKIFFQRQRRSHSEMVEGAILY